jgi:hypothetical protein
LVGRTFWAGNRGKFKKTRPVLSQYIWPERVFWGFFINIYFQEAFSQSDFQKGPELNKQINKEDMHILHNYYMRYI